MTEPQLEEAIFGERPAPQTRRERRRQQPRRRSGRTRTAILAGMVVIVAALVFAFGALTPMVSSFFSRNDYDGPGAGRVEVTIEEGASGGAIAAKLAKLDVIKTQSAFVEASSADPAASSAIQPGTYALKRQMRAADALAVLADPSARVKNGLTIKEGLWASEIYALLAKDSGDPVSAYRKAANKVMLPAGVKVSPDAQYRLEGWLFPKTYNFPQSEKPQARLQRMVDETVKELESLDVPRDQWERTLTVASIVDGEAGSSTDRGKVARVILNRLEPDPTGQINNMLQMDSSVHYVYQQRGDVETTDEMRRNPSPYNTYMHPGLPPGPINNPGVAAIEAAVKPTPGKWLYFVTIDQNTGETLFAQTWEEHQQNLQKWSATR